MAEDPTAAVQMPNPAAVVGVNPAAGAGVNPAAAAGVNPAAVAGVNPAAAAGVNPAAAAGLNPAAGVGVNPAAAAGVNQATPDAIDSGNGWPARDPRAALVGLIMGSDSDWPVMSGAGEMLDDFGVGYEVGVVSAHRTPQRMLDYASRAAERGLRVIIAGAGGAAHLPGMVAAATVLPVIGVPVPLATLDGMDSLLSIVQMPTGIPVACVSIGGARNAALLAVRILAVGEDALARSLALGLARYAADLQESVLAKHQGLRERTGH